MNGGSRTDSLVAGFTPTILRAHRWDREHFQWEQLHLEDDVESHLTQINLNLCELLVTLLVWTREFYKAFLILTPDYWM